MTNDEILDRLLYLKLSEELDLGIIQDRINLLEKYPSIVFHPCQLFGIRDIFIVDAWTNDISENTKYGNIDTATFTHAVTFNFSKGNKTSKLKLDYAPNFNKITKGLLDDVLYIEGEKYGLNNYYFNQPSVCFLNKDDAIKFQQRNNKEIKND